MTQSMRDVVRVTVVSEVIEGRNCPYDSLADWGERKRYAGVR